MRNINWDGGELPFAETVQFVAVAARALFSEVVTEYVTSPSWYSYLGFELC